MIGIVLVAISLIVMSQGESGEGKCLWVSR
jgi:hypothetical protein